jgi:hypothetical protein
MIPAISPEVFVDARGIHGFVLRDGEVNSFDYPGAAWSWARGINDQATLWGPTGGPANPFRELKLQLSPTMVSSCPGRASPHDSAVRATYTKSPNMVSHGAGETDIEERTQYPSY